MKIHAAPAAGLCRLHTLRLRASAQSIFAVAMATASNSYPILFHPDTPYLKKIVISAHMILNLQFNIIFNSCVENQICSKLKLN